MDSSSNQNDEVELAAARMIYEQHQYLLDDAREYAEQLKGARRTSSTLLVVVLGFGALKASFGDTGLYESVPLWAFILVVASLICTGVALLVGAYFIFTDSHLKWGGERKSSEKPKAALHGLYLEDNELLAAYGKGQIDLYKMRTESLRASYHLLKKANRRVRRRLVTGTTMLLIAIGTSFVGILVYTLSAGGQSNDSFGHNNQAECQSGYQCCPGIHR